MQYLVLRNKQTNSLFDVFAVDFEKETTEMIHEALTFEQASAIVDTFNNKE